MATANYRKQHEGGLGVTRLGLAALVMAGIAYVGGKVDADQRLDEMFNGKKVVADGYADVALQKRVNGEGRVVPSLVYLGNGKPVEFPVFAGLEGPQAGSLEYVLRNIDFSKMTSEQKASYTERAWELLEKEQKYKLMLAELTKLLSR